MEMKEINKMQKYWKIQNKIDLLILKEYQKWNELSKIREQIDKLKNEQEKYE